MVHPHSTHRVALTQAGVWHEDDILPPLTPYQVMKVGHIPLIAYERPGSPKADEQSETGSASPGGAGGIARSLWYAVATTHRSIF